MGEGFRPTVLTMISILLCSMLMLMGGAAVAPALPLINEVFPGQDFLVSLIITLPSLVIALVGFGMGALADRFGKVRVLVLSLVVFTISGAISYFLDDLAVILIARAVLGVGLAGVSTAVTALIAEYYSGVNRVKMMSYQSAAIGVGILVLEYTGDSLAEISWRAPFLVYLLGVPILICVLMSMREPRHMGCHPDCPMPDDRKADVRIIILCYLAIFLMNTMSFLMPTKMTFYLEDIGVTASMVGLFLGVHGIVNSVVSLMYHRINSRVHAFTLMSVGFLLMGLALCILMIDGSVSMAMVTLVVSGVAMGIMIPSIANTLASQTTHRSSGKIMGGYATCMNLGQFSISLISVPLFTAVGCDYPTMFAAIGSMAFVLAVVYGLYGTHLRRSGVGGLI